MKDDSVSSKETFYPEAQFGGFTDIDGTVAFFNKINALLDSCYIVLNVGCLRLVIEEQLPPHTTPGVLVTGFRHYIEFPLAYAASDLLALSVPSGDGGNPSRLGEEKIC